MKVQSVTINLDSNDLVHLMDLFKGYFLSFSIEYLNELASKSPREYEGADEFVYNYLSYRFDATFFKTLVRSCAEKKKEHIDWLAGDCECDPVCKLPVPQSLKETKSLLMAFGDDWLGEKELE